MKKHVTEKQTDEDRLSNDWSDEVTIANKYEKQRLEFLNFLEEYADIWDSHLRRIKTAKHRIELSNDNVCPMNSARYRAGPKERQFEATKSNRMFEEEVIEPATTKWASPIVF